MFKLALNAGHGLYTPGKRCLKSMDKNETREWVLNSRICSKIEKILSDYDSISVLRIDDISGKTDRPISERAGIANTFNADLYLSIHHNAGINGGKGGGIMAFTYLYVDDVTREWQKLFYDSAIKNTGLSGNRVSPLSKADLGECRITKMPAILMECGFMDSAIDTPIILTEKYADELANAFSDVIINKMGLKAKICDSINNINQTNKQIGEYKMSHILSNPISVSFSADGIPCTQSISKSDKYFTGKLTDEEINFIMASLTDYYNVTTERIGLDLINDKALKNAYISGSAVIYTYWDDTVNTGLYADNEKNISIKGDINCEVLDIENIYFGDPFSDDVQNQPYIIIASLRNSDNVIREAENNGADLRSLRKIKDNSVDGKILVLTKLYKEYKANGSYTIKSVKVTENSVIKRTFDTGLRLYPLAVFCWEQKKNCAYGDSEITYLIPNQIAINRMITANVWSSMTTGMPMMVVNGDTVTDDISNDPGQIIKVFGSNEDVSGAVKYVTPPAVSQSFDNSINCLIENTLTQSGANQVALGDSKADNASALVTMRDAAVMPLQMIKTRFYCFIEQVARIFADFWVSYYGTRKIKIADKSGIWYLPFDGQRYKDLIINTNVKVNNDNTYTERECTEALITLYEKGVIDKVQLLNRLPNGIISDKDEIIKSINREDNDNDRL